MTDSLCFYTAMGDSSTMQQRREEILAKKAKLAELKRQRELRQKEFTAHRQSIGDASEVCPLNPLNVPTADTLLS